jgi:hypothetical protein
MFSDKQKLKKLVASRLLLQEMLMDVLHAEGNDNQNINLNPQKGMMSIKNGRVA